MDDVTGIVSVAYEAFDGSDGVDQNTGGTNGVYQSTNTYLAFSADGGTTFNNVRVSDIPHYTAPIPGFAIYAGDYLGLCSYNGKAYVTWADNRISTVPNKLWQIYVSEVDFNGYSYVYATTPNNLNVNGNITLAPTGTSFTQTYDAVH